MEDFKAIVAMGGVPSPSLKRGVPLRGVPLLTPTPGPSQFRFLFSVTVTDVIKWSLGIYRYKNTSMYSKRKVAERNHKMYSRSELH